MATRPAREGSPRQPRLQQLSPERSPQTQPSSSAELSRSQPSDSSASAASDCEMGFLAPYSDSLPLQADATDMLKLLAAGWKELSEAEQQKWKAEAEVDKDRYFAEVHT